MAETHVRPQNVAGNPPDAWRHAGDAAIAALDLPVRQEREAATIMFGVELALRSIMAAGADPGQVKLWLMDARPNACGLLSVTEISALMKRLDLWEA